MRDTYTGPLWVPGHPLTKGSQKCVTPHVGGKRGILKPDNKRAEAWQDNVANTLAWRNPALSADPLQVAVELDLEFHIAKAKKPTYPDAPIGHDTGDVDKLTRCIGDAVQNSGLIKDDSIITRIVAEKIYAGDQGEGVTVELRPYVAPDLTGHMPVRITAGRTSRVVGSVSSVRELPRLLRAVADQMERANAA